MKKTKRAFNLDCFHKLSESSHDVLFWQTDNNLEITYINSALSSQIGYTQNELIGLNIQTLLLTETKNFWQDVVTQGAAFNDIVFKLIGQSGQLSYLNASGNTIVKGGLVVGYCGLCTLKTDNVISQHVIKKLQNTNKTIINSLSEAIVIIDSKQKITLVSPKFDIIWGFIKGDLFINPMQETLEKMRSLLLLQDETSLSFVENLETFEKTSDLLKFKDGRVIERRSSPYVFKHKIIGRCWYFKDVTQQSQLVDKLGKLAFRDSLTKLYNRRWCEKKLKQSLEKGGRTDATAFLYMDLDHFKVINDSCGHIRGDDALEQVSQLLLDTLGYKSYLARLGGDEFGLILTHKSKSKVIAIAEKIKKAIGTFTYKYKKKTFNLGVSIGIVYIDETDDFRSVFIHADEACYISKEKGKNTYTIYQAEKKEFQKTQTELKWYDAIQNALLKRDFELWYQPINSQECNESHYEILLRMKSETGELVSPSLFMSSADRFGLIYTIDKLVIESFCQFYHKHHRQMQNSLYAINLSGHSLSRDNLLPFVLKCLEKYHINYTDICFEITESELINNLEKALVFIKEIRKLGCKISLDDFGKGLTSFSYLKNIPYDFIKIDGQFIKEYEKDKINEAIIKSIVYIAEVMGKKTIAEHIESKQLLDQISNLGVDYFQGHYFSEPHQITKLLE